MSRLKKQAKTLGNFQNYELDKIQDIINYL